uniref:Uncharacterized protein n=1 Tax=Romanomermis culicivorax TaxID=13658 RepID=A0A915JU45_ROMCU
MVEKLLQAFVDEINPQLFERIEVKNFETGDIQNADEEATFQIAALQSFVATLLSAVITYLSQTMLLLVVHTVNGQFGLSAKMPTTNGVE